MSSLTYFQDPRSERMLGMGSDHDIMCLKWTQISQSGALGPALALERTWCPRSVSELCWEIPPRVRPLCLNPPVGPPPGSLCCLPRPWVEQDCPKYPSGLVIPVDGAELAGSFVFELEGRLAGSCCPPRARSTFAERPLSLPECPYPQPSASGGTEQAAPCLGLSS